MHFNKNIHMMDIIKKHHFQSHWHMLLLDTNRKAQQLAQKLLLI